MATPLVKDETVAMDTVNVLVMGEANLPCGLLETTPTSFHHVNVGRFIWKKTFT